MLSFRHKTRKSYFWIILLARSAYIFCLRAMNRISAET